ARRVHLLAPQLIGRAGGQAEPAVHAVRHRRRELAARVKGAHQVPGAHRVTGAHRFVHHSPPAKRPGAIRCPGSNWSLTARIRPSEGTGPQRSTASYTGGGACTTIALASTGGPSGTAALAGRASPSPRARPARSADTNATTASVPAPAG